MIIMRKPFFIIWFLPRVHFCIFVKLDIRAIYKLQIMDYEL